MTSSSRLVPGLVRTALVLGALLALNALGCAFGEIRPSDPFDRELTLDRMQHQYTTMVRFSEFDKAQQYVHDDHKEAFMDRMKALEDARFTDFDSEDPEPSDDLRSATVRVTYKVYTPYMPYEVEVEETQVWSREGMGNSWRVWSTFEGLSQIAAN